MRDFNDIEDLFADEFGGEQVTPPASVKKDIDHALFGRKKGGIIRLWLIILLLLITGIGSVYLLGTSNDIATTSKESSILAEDQTKIETREYPSNSNSDVNKSTMSTSTYEKEDETASDKKEIDQNERNTGVTSLSNPAKSRTFKSERSRQNYRSVLPYLNGETDNEKKTTDPETKENKIRVTNVKKEEESKQSNLQHEEENRGMEITSKLSVADAQTIEPPLKDTTAYMPKVEDASKRSMSVSLYAGLNQGFGGLNYSVQPLLAQQARVSESTSLNIGAEWGLRLTDQFGVSTGFEYNKVSSEVIETTTYPDSILIDSTLVDSTYIYVMMDLEETETAMIMSSSFSVPLNASFHFGLGTNAELNLFAGARLNFLSQKFVDSNSASPNPELKSFGMSLMLRPEYVYNFDRFGIGVYGRFGVDVMDRMKWVTLKRNRFESGGGLILRYNF